MHYPVGKAISSRVYAENPEDFQKLYSQNNTALLSQGGAVIFSETGTSPHAKGLAMGASPFAPEKKQFAVNTLGGRNNEFQTFNIILPNFIHKSRKKNLKRS